MGDCSILVKPLGAAGFGPAQRLAGAPHSPASMIKVPLAAAVYGLAAAGALDLDRPVEVSPANMTANDARSPLEPGFRTTIDELVYLMVARSDNVATNELIDAAGRDSTTAWLHGAGLRQTFVRRKLSGSDPLIDDPGACGRNAHPAEDSAALFEMIAAAAVPGTDPILRALREQVWNDKLPAGFHDGDTFEHKTGDTSDVSHDGGILSTREGRRYVIVVYTPLASSPRSDAKLAAFARTLRALL